MAYVRKLPSGRWQGIAKSGRERLGTKVYDRRVDAIAWAERVEATAAGGVDVRAGRSTVKSLLPEWVELRHSTVSPTTAITDSQLLRLVSPALKARAVGAVQVVDIEKWFLHLRKSGQSDASIKRYRASISSFFAWTVKEHRRPDNPVKNAVLPTRLTPAKEMRPFTETEFEEVVQLVRQKSEHLADVLLVLGWTGLRWGEARALRVLDLQRVPSPALRVARSQTEGQAIKVTKGRSVRRVPLRDALVPVVLRMAENKRPTDFLFTGPDNGQLWAAAFKRTTGWSEVSQGRRLHDLRHTAACTWLSRGVDLSTVAAWMGHASVTTTNGYLHYLGTSADRAGIELLNSPRGAYGALTVEMNHR